MASLVETANDALAQLRARPAGQQALVNGERLAPGIWFDMDVEQAQHAGTWAAPQDALIGVTLQATRPGRWFTLNIDLGNAEPGATALIGFALRSKAPRTQLVRACIRNFFADGFKDVFFPLHIAPFAEESSHADVLWLADRPSLTQPANWRTMIFFFDPAGVEVTLTDLRLFAA